MSPYIYALFSNMSFGFSAQFLTYLSRKIYPMWANACKCSFYFAAFFILVMLTGGLTPGVTLGQAGVFAASGAAGLFMADYFLLKAFAEIGPGRTMVFYAFHPLIVGAGSYFLFGQTVNPVKFLSIILFIICVFIFALESFKNTSKWGAGAIFTALAAISLDACGTLISRIGFEYSAIRPLEGNFYRTAGAMVFFVLYYARSKRGFWTDFKALGGKGRALAATGAVFGTLGLLFSLMAVQVAHMASLSGMLITGVVFSALFECIWQKKWPSKYLVISFVFFLAGMYLLLGVK